MDGYYYTWMDIIISEWINGCTQGMTDGWMDVCTVGWVYRWMYVHMDVCMYRWMGVQMDGEINGQIN